MLPVSCFINARYAPAEDMLSIDATKTLPAKTWREEPLRKTIAAAPDSNPKVPPAIWTGNKGDMVQPPSFSESQIPQPWLVPSISPHSRPQRAATQSKPLHRGCPVLDCRGQETSRAAVKETSASSNPQASSARPGFEAERSTSK